MLPPKSSILTRVFHDFQFSPSIFEGRKPPQNLEKSQASNFKTVPKPRSNSLAHPPWGFCERKTTPKNSGSDLIPIPLRSQARSGWRFFFLVFFFFVYWVYLMANLFIEMLFLLDCLCLLCIFIYCLPRPKTLLWQKAILTMENAEVSWVQYVQSSYHMCAHNLSSLCRDFPCNPCWKGGTLQRKTLQVRASKSRHGQMKLGVCHQHPIQVVIIWCRWHFFPP